MRFKIRKSYLVRNFIMTQIESCVALAARQLAYHVYFIFPGALVSCFPLIREKLPENI